MSTRPLLVLYTTDLHGHVSPFTHRSGQQVGGLAHLVTALHQARQSHPGVSSVWVDCGDSLANGLLSDLTQGRPLLQVFERQGLDALVVGNHEFDPPWGRHGVERAGHGSSVPFLAANLRDVHGRVPPGLADLVLVERDGLRVVILGVTTPDAPLTALPDNIHGLEFLSVEDALTACEPLVESLRPHVRILAAHAGPQAVRRAAERARHPWIIAGGHVDQAEEIPLEMGRCVYVKAGTYGENLGVLRVDVDLRRGGFQVQSNVLVPVGPPHQPPHAETQLLLSEAMADLVPLLERKVAETDIDLLRNDEGESLLDNLILDATRSSAETDVAVRNSTATRADLFTGPIHVGHLYAVIPWDEPIEITVLYHEDFVRILEHSVSPSVDPHVLQISGAFVRYDLARDDGRRVRHVRLDSGLVLVRDGDVVEPRGLLSVAGRPFLLQGGLGYQGFKKCLARRTGRVLREVVQDYLEQCRTVASVERGRLQFDGRGISAEDARAD